ncbi:hypothetical protein [Sphingobium sp. UBA5915]|uniref:hypothetical protein n=1 Tax=Sphingobium sp. UBA5915 TaxID=1947530 RepID=UPI0025F97597|nr:hypothetical protein [Sphingobium sp. UBA5915]
MAKSLNERIASARATDRVTITDLEALIAEVTIERDRFIGIVSQATADSIRFELSEIERDEAAQQAERAKRNSLAMSAAIDELAAKLTAKRASEEQRARAAEKAEALAERDALAERLRTEWPAAEALIIDLLSAIKSSDARLQALRLHEISAEAMARELPGNFMRGGVHVRRLQDARLPAFAEGNDYAWPKPQRLNLDLGRAQMIADREKMRAENARWSRYVVTPPDDNREVISLATREGARTVRDAPIIGYLTEEGANLARERGCRVRPAAANVTIGLPSAAFI